MNSIDELELLELIPDPSAVRDVIEAHQMYDAPNEPLVLSLGLYDASATEVVFGDADYE